MNAINQSSNRIPCHTDWHRYDSPTVFRRHGRDFLERSWKVGWAAKTTASLSKTELHNLVLGRFTYDPVPDSLVFGHFLTSEI